MNKKKLNIKKNKKLKRKWNLYWKKKSKFHKKILYIEKIANFIKKFEKLFSINY